MGKACRKMRKFAMGGEVDNNAVLSGLLQQLQTQNKPEPLTQAQTVNADMNNLGKIDPVAGEGRGAQHNWMVQSASDVARQAGVNPNAAYRPGSASDPHAAGIAQPQQQMIGAPEIPRNAPTQNRMTPISEMFGKRRYADGGKVEDVEALLARMKGKYGVSSKSTPEPAPQPVQQPVQQPATNPGIGHGVINVLKGRREQIDKASGYANGGKIKGPGTPTSDSIDASVKQTGEPIKVSTDERILSKAQDVELSKIASDLGFPSLDSWLETMTGKPVGPTMKGGIAHAATGWKLPKNAKFSWGSDVPDEQPPSQNKGGAAVNSELLDRNEADKESLVSGFAKPLAAAADIGTLPVRAVMGAANTLLRVPNAFGASIPYIPESAFGGSSSSPTPYYDKVRSSEKLMNPGTGPNPLGIAAEAASNNQGSARSIAMGADADAAMHDKQRPMPIAPGGIARINTKGQSPLFTNIDPGLAAQQIAGMKSGAVQMGSGEKDPGWINDAYGNDQRPTLAMKAQLAEMQRARYGRDMGVDIKDPRVIATAALNLQRMNQNAASDVAQQQAQQQGISAGLDQQVKRNSLAQFAQQQNMLDRLNDPTLTPEKRQALYNDILVSNGKNPNKDRYMQQPNRKVYGEMGQIIGEEPGGIFDTVARANVGQNQQQSSFSKEEVNAALKAGASKDEVIKRIKDLGKNPKDYGL